MYVNMFGLYVGCLLWFKDLYFEGSFSSGGYKDVIFYKFEGIFMLLIICNIWV